MSDVTDTCKVLLYSHDRTVREKVRLALGRKVARDLPEVEIFEVATGPAVIRALDAGTDYSLIIMDGDAQPEGGFGLAYRIKDEYPDCPPVLLLLSRLVDTWLGTWSRAEALAPYPIDPVALPGQVADLIRDRRALAL